MKVSVIIPAHNESDCIKACLNSITKQGVYEIIVVNDGSTDDTSSVARSFKGVKVIDFTKGHSAAFARMQGAKQAKGDVLCFIDADQTLSKGFFKGLINDYAKKDVHAVAWWVKSPSKMSIYQRALRARRSSLILPKVKTVFNKRKGFPVLIFSMLKKVFNDLGGYDTNVFYFEDMLLTDEFFAKGYTAVFDPELFVIHEDPRDFNAFIRQSRWMGKGLKTIKNKQRKFYIKSVLLNAFKIIILFTVFTPVWFVLPLFIIVRSLQLILKSRDIKGSLFFILLSTLRSFYVLRYAL